MTKFKLDLGPFPKDLKLEPGDRFRVAIRERTPNLDDYGDMQKLNGHWLTVQYTIESDMMASYAPNWSHRVQQEPRLRNNLNRGPETYYWQYYHMDQIERKGTVQRIPIQKKDLLPPV